MEQGPLPVLQEHRGQSRDKLKQMLREKQESVGVEREVWSIAHTGGCPGRKGFYKEVLILNSVLILHVYSNHLGILLNWRL